MSEFPSNAEKNEQQEMAVSHIKWFLRALMDISRCSQNLKEAQGEKASAEEEKAKSSDFMAELAQMKIDGADKRIKTAESLIVDYFELMNKKVKEFNNNYTPKDVESFLVWKEKYFEWFLELFEAKEDNKEIFDFISKLGFSWEKDKKESSDGLDKNQIELDQKSDLDSLMKKL